MKKLLILLLLISAFSFAFVSRTNAQMMGSTGIPATTSEIQAQQQEELEGKDLITKLNSKSISCQQLTDVNFEKIGEYFMGQSIGDTSIHIATNNRMKVMMGDSGEEQVHIAWGKRGSNCDTNAINSANPEGGVFPMMGFYSGMMNWNSGWGVFGILGVVFCLVVFVDIVLLGIWLWKQINNNKK